MSEFNLGELKYYALIFGVILLILIAYRQAVKKVQRDRETKIRGKPASRATVPAQVEKPRMTEEQFKHSWRNLSYLLLLAGVGNLYMAYTALTKVLAVPAADRHVFLGARFRTRFSAVDCLQLTGGRGHGCGWL